MRRTVAVAIGGASVVVAALSIWLAVVPLVEVERGLSLAPVPEGALITEDVRRSGDDCGALICTQRIRVHSLDQTGSEACEFVADRLSGDVAMLAIGELGVARCGWVVRRGDVLVGLIVEDAPGGTELVVSSRLAP